MVHPEEVNSTGPRAGDVLPDDVSAAFDDPRIVQHVKDYLAAVEEGSRPNLQELVAQYPEMADELTACLKGLDFVCRVVPHVRQQAAAAVEVDSADFHAPAVCGGVGPQAASAVQERGPGRRFTASSQHRPGLLGGLRASRALLCHGLHRGADLGRSDRPVVREQ